MTRAARAAVIVLATYLALLGATSSKSLAGAALATQAQPADKGPRLAMTCHEGVIANSGRWSAYRRWFHAQHGKYPEDYDPFNDAGWRSGQARDYIKQNTKNWAGYGDINPNRDGVLTKTPPGGAVVMMRGERHSVLIRDDAGRVYEMSNHDYRVFERLNETSLDEILHQRPRTAQADRLNPVMVLKWKPLPPDEVLDYDAVSPNPEVRARWFELEFDIKTEPGYDRHVVSQPGYVTPAAGEDEADRQGVLRRIVDLEAAQHRLEAIVDGANLRLGRIQASYPQLLAAADACEKGIQTLAQSNPLAHPQAGALAQNLANLKRYHQLFTDRLARVKEGLRRMKELRDRISAAKQRACSTNDPIDASLAADEAIAAQRLLRGVYEPLIADWGDTKRIREECKAYSAFPALAADQYKKTLESCLEGDAIVETRMGGRAALMTAGDSIFKVRVQLMEVRDEADQLAGEVIAIGRKYAPGRDADHWSQRYREQAREIVAKIRGQARSCSTGLPDETGLSIALGRLDGGTNRRVLAFLKSAGEYKQLYEDLNWLFAWIRINGQRTYALMHEARALAREAAQCAVPLVGSWRGTYKLRAEPDLPAEFRRSYDFDFNIEKTSSGYRVPSIQGVDEIQSVTATGRTITIKGRTRDTVRVGGSTKQVGWDIQTITLTLLAGDASMTGTWRTESPHDRSPITGVIPSQMADVTARRR